jgi:hypothetical protein
MEIVGRESRNLATLLAFVVALALAASSTHALHLPELIGSMRVGQGAEHQQMSADADNTPRYDATDAPIHDIWCSVEALAPTATNQLLVLQVWTDALVVLAWCTQCAWSTVYRTKPPPLIGRRLRATLQVFLN